MMAQTDMLGELDFHLIAQGRHWNLADRLGAHTVVREGRTGVRFAVWAPNARSVSVVGDFNGWDGNVDKMYLHRGAGIWELFVPQVTPRSEEHTSELQSRENIVCRLLLEKKQ